MRLLVGFVLCCLALIITLAESSTRVERPRGVSLTNKVFYDSSVDFTCLDGSKTISFSYVNDDYCDCADGSDEPGTSACSNGRFHCVNAGFKPKNIVSSRVNDGICDCCDGSDEWKLPRACTNTCVSLYKVEQQQREVHNRVRNAGKLLKQQYAQTGAAARHERESRLKEIEEKLGAVAEEERIAAEDKKYIETRETELLAKWNEIKAEAKRVAEEKADADAAKLAFGEMDVNHDAVLTLHELLLHKELDPDTADETFTTVEAEALLGTEVVNVDIFIAQVWPLIKASYKSSSEVQLPPPPPAQEETEEEAPQPGDEEDDGYDIEDDDDDRDDDEPAKVEPSAEQFKAPEYDEETREVIARADEKRRLHDDISVRKKSIETEMEGLKKKLELDYGPDSSYHFLEGKCFEYRTLEYKYELCPFDKTTQQPLNGGSTTSLGKWGRWSGPEERRYASMRYENGLGCWNGPARSTEVRLSCGGENRLTAVDEPSRCSYLFDFTTPCACGDDNTSGHDEL